MLAAGEAALQDILIPSEEAGGGRNEDATPTLSLVDRFDTILKVGRKIASALSPAMIFSEVHAAALRLLRGEHCLVLKIAAADGQEPFRPLAGSIGAGFRSSSSPRC